MNHSPFSDPETLTRKIEEQINGNSDFCNVDASNLLQIQEIAALNRIADGLAEIAAALKDKRKHLSKD